MLEYRLRPHHALCIGFFEGKGYSREFTENMTEIIELLNGENPETEITTDSDIICRCCPCTDCHEKALSYDMKVIEICGLSDKIKWEDLRHRVQKNIIKSGRLKEICGDCQWFYICEKKGLN
ncbi:MAG: DUF1284 domain-containing protein [Ruminococcus flavefaciens]|nr:DUF1284 domain-containing protein [Ruminococcus flavefaciens]